MGQSNTLAHLYYMFCRGMSSSEDGSEGAAQQNRQEQHRRHQAKFGLLTAETCLRPLLLLTMWTTVYHKHILEYS